MPSCLFRLNHHYHNHFDTFLTLKYKISVIAIQTNNCNNGSYTSISLIIYFIFSVIYNCEIFNYYAQQTYFLVSIKNVA